MTENQTTVVDSKQERITALEEALHAIVPEYSPEATRRAAERLEEDAERWDGLG